MDYIALAEELFESMIEFNKHMRSVNFNEAIQGESLILDLIRRKQADIVPTELGEEICVSSPRIAAVLNSLEKKGYIVREIDKNDRRRILIKITREGRDASNCQRKKMLEHFNKIFSLLGENDAKEYVRIMKKLIHCLKEDEN